MSRLSSPAGEGGMALVMVLLFSSALLLSGAAMLAYSFNEKIIADYQQEEVQLYYIAEAGLEAGLAALRRDFFHQDRITGVLNGGTFTVDFATPAAGKRSITSKGALGRSRKTIILNVEIDLLDGSKRLSADSIYLRNTTVYGSVHVNQLLLAEQGDNLISGSLLYHDEQPPLFAPEASLEVSETSCPTTPVPPIQINFELLSGQTTKTIPGGLLIHPPAEYPAHKHFFVDGDLIIAPQTGTTFDFSGLVYVQGDLTLAPADGSILLLEGIFAAEGGVTLLLEAPLNSEGSARTLLILAGGEIELLSAEENSFPVGGKQILYSHSALRIRGGSPAERLVLNGAFLAKQQRFENCVLYYESELLHSYVERLPGLGKLRVEWLKPN